jgi:hypothetical protein
VSRFRQNDRYGQLVNIQRAIADAHEAAHIERCESIVAARESARSMLLLHNLPRAGAAMRIGAASTWSDFKLIADRMRAGGYHRVRLTGGRGLDG